MLNERTFHLIPADFKSYKIDNLLTERKNSASRGKHGVPWINGGINGKNAQDFKVGDIVYVYFHNLTGEESRILLRCEVSALDDNYIDPETKNSYKVFYLDKIKYYTEAVYTYHKLKEYGVKLNRTKIYLGTYKDYIYFTKHDSIEHGYRNKTKEEYENLLNLINDLETIEKKEDLNALKEHYNKPCEICKTNDKNHTFKKENGLYYYEVHHILEQNILRKKEVPEWYKKFKKIDYDNPTDGLVYTNFNTVNLCPVCHRKIHYGLKEDRKLMLDVLLNEKRIRQYKEKVGTENLNKLLDYIYEQYSVKRVEKELIKN